MKEISKNKKERKKEREGERNSHEHEMMQKFSFNATTPLDVAFRNVITIYMAI